MNIVIVGTGYVGLVTGTCLADYGHDVVCVDTNAEKVEKLKRAESPIYEPGLSEIIKSNFENGRLSFSTSLRDSLQNAEAAFIAVSTPEAEDGSADLRAVFGVARDIARYAVKDLVVIVKSTVPIGTGDRVSSIIHEELATRKDAPKIGVASNPEFLQEGRAVQNFKTPDRIVIGVDDSEMHELFKDMYRQFVMRDPGRIIFMSRRSAELTKYAANAMLATRVSFMNELSRLADAAGANMDEIRHGMGYDERIGKKFLYAGPGYGGSCFPKDVSALIHSAKEYDVEMEVVEATQKANEKQKLYSVSKVRQACGGSLKGKTITLWGAAFKPETDDVRESPSITICNAILAEGGTVKIHDPKGLENFKLIFGDRLEYSKSMDESLKGSEVVALVTEWAEYRSADWKKIAAKFKNLKAVVDLRNQYEGEDITRYGLAYSCIGRPI